MTTGEQLRLEWPNMTREEREEFCTRMVVTTFRRCEASYSPRHPIYGTPSCETFRREVDAAAAQVDWFVSLG